MENFPQNINQIVGSVIDSLKEKGMSEEEIYLCLINATDVVAHSIAKKKALSFSN